MCGRFTLRTPKADLADAFDVQDFPLLEPRYNIAPTQLVTAIRMQDGTRHAVQLKWGLIPSWATELSLGAKMINARAETVAEKPAFRSAFKRRRCLIVTDGFYEWQKRDSGKQPYYITLKGGGPFAFAGLWEVCTKFEEPIESCTIITTSANDLMAPLHDRMPVILNKGDYNTWLDPDLQAADKVLPLLRPCASDRLQAVPVSTQVNNPRHNSADCVLPVSA